jgi:hypothetical protein
MKRWEAFAVHASTALVAGTGLVYAWMRYLLTPADEWAVVNHPLQPATQHLHVLTAPLLVFAIGLVWQQHVWGHWRRGVKQRRRSGLLLLGFLIPMVASGYLLQTAADEPWRRTWVFVHVATSLIFLLGYAGHVVAALMAWQRKRRVHGGAPPAAAEAARFAAARRSGRSSTAA